MFTGIIQSIGTVVNRDGVKLSVRGPLRFLKIGGSVAVDGVCLTLVQLTKGVMTFDLSEETFGCTTLGMFSLGQKVNLEGALRVGDAIGGHFVQGHVDGTGRIVSQKSIYEFSVSSRLSRLLASKCSVAVDGVSLTVVKVKSKSFTTAVIPYTKKHTTLGLKKAGDGVNIEVDMMARYRGISR
jgi:riboflavin synthase